MYTCNVVAVVVAGSSCFVSNQSQKDSTTYDAQSDCKKTRIFKDIAKKPFSRGNRGASLSPYAEKFAAQCHHIHNPKPGIEQPKKKKKKTPFRYVL